MFEKINTYFKLPSFIKKQGMISSSGLCCVRINGSELTAALSKKTEGKIEVQWCDAFKLSSSGNTGTVINEIVNRHQIANTPCVWVLNPNQYQLLLMETLPVPPAEFQEAIRWKIKEMVSFPVQDAVIDHFPLPPQQGQESHKMMMVVVTQNSFLQPMVEKFQDAGLDLTTIDVQGLALRNITSLYETDEKSSALIYVEDKNVQLIVTRQKLLYLTRIFDFGLDAISSLAIGESHQYLDKLGLELQRSFDYYQSQWRNPVPTRIFLATSKGSPQRIADYLSQRLTMSIHLMNISDVLLSKKEIQVDQQGKYLPVMGGLLRDEVIHDSTD